MSIEHRPNSALRQRMIEDDAAQARREDPERLHPLGAGVHPVPGRAPNTATAEDLRRYQ
jgi:hypothetical protein